MLWNHYRPIFDEIFEEEPLTIRNIISLWKENYIHRYTNRSKLRTIFVGGNEYAENVFICLVAVLPPDHQDRFEINWIKQYFVSDNDYNVNEVADGNYIVGRFIFFRNQENQLVVYAIAEECPSLSYNHVKSLYLRKRYRYSPSKWP